MNNRKKQPKKKPKISILIPFSSKDESRNRVFNWLLNYWRNELPHAEIIVGKSKRKVFCKGEALNNALRKSKGEVIVIMDADAYIEGSVIERCADSILQHKRNHLWYVPYRHLYRLTKETTEKIIHSPCNHPFRVPSPVPYNMITNKGHEKWYGHRYGAMCMIFPREAIEIVGGFDERFVGWGSEDISLLKALDTLYGKHKTMKQNMFHLWHPIIGETYNERKWEGQKNPNANANLGMRYSRAHMKPVEMRKLVDEKHKKK